MGPVMFPSGLEPDPVACGLVVKNCYMAFIRKIVHFYGTASLIPALTGVIFTVLAQSPRQTAGRKHCLDFLAKTRIA
ncbi:hypothetical protein P3T76_014545 [Phytophthora citrophthora]|uniref:Uncharacterized protein n=1 Tax=Phytophthora citrophthora TaxID=4793 RepID=A0AAD9G1A1_9STRA|nr:hypothetical protein P3T76_014545 [Phytophthora citrophthora]